VATDEPFVTLMRTTDPVRAEVIRDLLEQEGIPVAMTGQHHNALLGGAGFLIEIPIQVPRDRADEAADIINALDDESSVMVDEHGQPTDIAADADTETDFAHEAKREEGAGPYRSAPRRRPRAERPRLKRVAAFLASAIGLGTGHHYTREYTSGAILTLSELGAFFVGLETPAALLAIPMLRAIDLVGSLRACDRYNEGSPHGTGTQMVRTGGLVAASFGASIVVVPALVEALRPEPDPEAVEEVTWPDTRRLGGPGASAPGDYRVPEGYPAHDVVEEVTADDLLEDRRQPGESRDEGAAPDDVPAR